MALDTNRKRTPQLVVGAITFACMAAAGCDERLGELPILEQTPMSLHGHLPSSAPLTEAESVDALTSLNHGEISLARYAIERARTPIARDLAQMMMDQHTDAQANVAAWAQTAAVAPVANDVTRTIEGSLTTVRSRLDSTPDADFDVAYVRSQVEMHQDALRILDERILPGAHDEHFRALATTIRSAVAMHLAHARSIADVLRP